MRNVLDKICRENQNTYFTCNNFFRPSKTVLFTRVCVGKYSTAGQATEENVAHTHCKMDNWGYRHTPKICNTYCFSMALMVMRMHFNL